MCFQGSIMLQRLEDLAEISVARGCGFAAMAIVTFMVGFHGDMMRATQIGGVLTLLLALVLIVRGLAARAHPYKRTELWVLLKPAERPRPEIAQQLIGAVLRDTYLRYGMRAAEVAAGLLMISLILALWTN